mmetsp:Transcript_19503/g.45363  ORF Transcript_19503/g.45363 Transcript_19503/m.45363 type:complete len:134 (+) Transcript_19503:454-855(+)
MVRMNLDPFGIPLASKDSPNPTFRFIVWFIVILNVLEIFFHSIWNILLLFENLYLVVITWMTRRFVRKQFDIPQQCHCEDFYCALCCRMCVIMQLARHTADYDVEHAHPCTEDGLLPRQRNRQRRSTTEETHS